MAYTIGLDYGTNSVRGIVVDTSSGWEVATAVYAYPTGEKGIILDGRDHNLARQYPGDYITGMETVIKAILKDAAENDKAFAAEKVIGIGIDTTGSTPLPVDADGVPLAMQEQFKDNPNAQAWLWKDHTAYAEAAEITALAEKEHPEYLAKCGGTYSSEWFFSKILHCLRVDAAVFDAAYTWVEYCDYVPAVLTGTTHPSVLKRGRCAAGHKAMFAEQWGGLPAKAFLAKLDAKLGDLHDRLYGETATIADKAGDLTENWAEALGLPVGIPVAIGAFDAHLGAVGSGVRPGVMVNTIGTSSCIMTVVSTDTPLRDIPGLCGIVDGSILPGYWGLEAGQSAVGDIFNWYVDYIMPGGKEAGSHEALTEKAMGLKPGESGLLALDWNNGNRTILVDQRLTGLLLGQTLHTRPEEIYRALVEASAFGVLTIINRMEEYGVAIHEVVNCGGIAEKNAMLMQIYADVMGREMKVSRSAQTCALGAAMAGAVAAGAKAGGFDNYAQAQEAMSGLKEKTYTPDPQRHAVYKRLYGLYKQVHDAFGIAGHEADVSNVMKELLTIKDAQRG